MGNEGCGESITFLLCHYLFITLFLCSKVRSLPLSTVLHARTWVLLMSCCSSRTAPACVLSMGCSPSRMNCSNVGLPGATSTARKLALVWAPLHWPQLLPGACSCVGSPWAATSFRAHLPASVQGPPQAVVWICAPTWSSMGCRETTQVIMVFSRGCRGIFAPALGAPPPPPSSLTLVSGAESIPDGLIFGQWWVNFEADWNWLCPTWGQLLVSSHRSHSCSTSSPPRPPTDTPNTKC